MKPVRWTPMLVLFLALAAGCGKSATPARPEEPVTLRQAVERARLRHHLPAVAAASFSLDEVEVAASGVRRLGTTDSVTTGDLFHLGSLAKGMTATAIATLVDDGSLDWSLTLAAAFPEFVATMDPAYREVTLAELLKNRGGVPGFNDLEEFATIPPFAGDAVAQRRAFAGWILAQAPACARGTYRYSTAGFAIAAAIAEGRSGRPWEQVLRAGVLDPLGVSMFVGWPLEAGANEPCGHMLDAGALRPVEPAEGHVPPVVAPGGDVSMTVGDYARFAQLHLRALCGRPSLLSAAAWQQLHAPVGDYAMGWSVIEADGNTALTHTGSADTFYAFVVLYEKQRHGFVIVTNAVTPEVEDALVDIVVAMAPSMSDAPAAPALAAGAGR